MNPTQTKKLALSFAGGGARAFCYFGFLRELESQGIKIDQVLAYSGGAIVMCYMVSGMSDPDIIRKFAQFRYNRFLSPLSIFTGGFYSLDKLADYMTEITGGRDICQLPYKTGICISDITDWNAPKQIVNWEGDLAAASAISCAIGGVFPTYKSKDGRIFADGGYTSLYSAKLLREEGADVVLGLYPDGLKYMNIPGPLSSLARVMKAENSARNLYERATEPVDLEITDFDTKAGLSDFHMAEEMYDSGRRRAQEMLPQILQLIS